MRYLVCILIGLFMGAMLGSITAHTLGQRNAWPRAVMQVMQHELAGTRRAVHAGRCGDEPAQRAKAHLALLAGDLTPAFPGLTEERAFRNASEDFTRAVADWQPASDCKAEDAALAAIAQQCDNCHRQYR